MTPSYPLFRAPSAARRVRRLLVGFLLTAAFGARAQNVGIGTTQPTQTLDVNGTLRVRGLSGAGNRLLSIGADGTLGVNANLFNTSPATTSGALTAGGSTATGAVPTGVAANGSLAYVVSFFGQALDIYDASNPAAPVLRGSVATEAGPNDVVVSGTRAYVVNQDAATVQIFDVGVATAPVLLGGVGVSPNPLALAVSGTTVYVVSTNGTLDVVDAANPTAPVVRATLAVSGGARGVAASGTRAYVVNESDNTLLIVDASNPAAPVALGSAPLGSAAIDVEVRGTTVYVPLLYSNELRIYDGSGAAPVLLGTAPTTDSFLSGVALTGSTAYVVGGGTLEGFSVGAPASPTATGPAVPSGGSGVAASGGLVYVIDRNQSVLQVYTALTASSVRTVVVDADGALASVPTPAAPTLALSGQDLSISGGNTVTLPAATDVQQLGFSGTTLTLTNGGTADLSALRDNLGNHTATTNLGLNGNWLSNAPGTANGLRIDGSGNVGIGTSTPRSRLSVSNVTTQSNTPNQIIGELSFVGFNRPLASASIVAQSPGWDDASHLIFKTSVGGAGAQERMRLSSDGTLTVNSLGGNGTRMVTTDNTGILTTQALPTGDNLGNHTATQALNLGTNALVGNGGTTGLRISSAGSVGIGTTTGPATLLDVRTTDNSAAITVGSTGGGAGALYLGNANHGLRRNYTSNGNDVGLFTTSGNLYLSAGGNTSTSQFALLSDGRLGIGTSGPAASAALDVSSTTKGFLPPRMSQTERNAIGGPAAGLTIYNTTTGKLNTWNGTSWTETLTTTEQPLQNPTVTFNTPGAAQYLVPAGVTRLTVTATGARGGSNTNGRPGGLGARVTTTLTVNPGETLTVQVGGAGGTAPVVNGNGGGGGYNGGGNGFSSNGGGGGATDIRRGAALTDRLVVAGGGGGASNSSNGGDAGFPNGAAGQSGLAGQGGTQTAGGTGIGGPGASGSLGQGGSLNGVFTGGGAGLYGGGAGSSGGGGGGSSGVPASGATATSYTAGVGTGDGSLTLTPGAVVAAPVLDGANISGAWDVNGTSYYYNAGNVGIGTSTPTARLEVDGGISARSTSPISEQGAHLQWNRSGGEGETWLLNQKGTGNVYAGVRFGKSDANDNVTEWARFIDDGNLGLGTVTPDAKLDIESDAPKQLILTSTSTDPTGIITVNFPATNSVGNTATELVVFNKAGHPTPIGQIIANLGNNTVNYSSVSDRRLKEHIRPTHFGLADLLRIEVKDYNFIGTAAANRTTGFLAQDLFRIYPDAVKEGDAGATVTNAWAVDYGKLTPLLVQAIQDQQTLIDAQRAEIVALQARAAAAEAKAEATTETFEARLRALEVGSGQARK